MTWRDAIGLALQFKDKTVATKWICETIDRLKASAAGAPWTTENAMQGLELSLQAANAKLPQLSRRAMSESLRGGKPTAEIAAPSPLMTINDASNQVKIAMLLGQLISLWSTTLVPSSDAFIVGYARRPATAAFTKKGMNVSLVS